MGQFRVFTLFCAKLTLMPNYQSVPVIVFSQCAVYLYVVPSIICFQHANNVYVAPLSHARTPKNDYIPRSTARRLSQPRVLPESVLFIRAGSLPPRSSRTKIDYDDDIADIEASLRAPTPPPPPPPVYRKTPRRFVKVL